MEENPTRVCELIVGLGEVEVLGVDDEAGGALGLHIQTRRRPACGGCGGAVWSKGTSAVNLVDLPAFGRPVRLIWHKWRWCCPAAGCGVGSFTEIAEEIAPARAALTARAGRWATLQVGRDARPVSDVAAELSCDWHTANRAVLARGQALLAADCDGVGTVEALGFDETLFGRQGAWRARRWCTSIVDVTGGQLLDIVPGRDAQAPVGWLLDQPQWWRDGINWGVSDLSGAYRRSFDVALPRAGQVADPFHVIRLANNSIDETRRRVQNDTLGDRGRKDDPLWRARRLLIAAHERLSDRGDAKLRGLLRAGDPRGEVRLAWHANQTLRGLYDIDCSQLAGAYLGELADDLTRHRQPAGAAPPGPHPRSLARRHRELAPRPGHQRPHRGDQQSCQTRQARRFRIPPVRPLQDPGAALRRQTQLGATRHRHSPAEDRSAGLPRRANRTRMSPLCPTVVVGQSGTPGSVKTRAYQFFLGVCGLSGTSGNLPEPRNGACRETPSLAGSDAALCPASGRSRIAASSA